MSDNQVVPYETPKVTSYGDIVALTQAVFNDPKTDALCAGNNPVQGVPSGVVCKQIP
jgi:hypothetical protein